MQNAEERKISRASGRFSRANAVALAILALGLTILGADKSPATRALQRFLSRGQASAVTSAEIADGYRVAGTDAGGPVEMPAGAVTNDLLRRRGGYDWAFRVEPDGWRSSWRDGFLTGVTVLARGEVRPDVGTLYYPVPVTNGVSLLPEARWGLLPNGCASVFSHAVTTNGSLLLDWRNAAVGRDANSPTNMQLEIFGDGSFVWRTDGGSTSYLPVLPFDWDGDGLENSVDPEPLTPNPVDAHGTSAEWYRIVCSNVFTTADNPDIPQFSDSNISFRPEVNTNAYYFVDVVASQGAVPIYFNADQDSRLGSPVVVARAGETNRVPLLIGVEYSVTSTVPFSVTVPEGGFAEANQRDERNCLVKWPLEFEVATSEDGHTVTVTPIPYDPGGVFEWNPAGGGSGGARLMSASPSTCSYAANGGCVSWGCGTDSCGCRGCSISGTCTLEEAILNLPTVWCGCWEDDPEEPEPTPEPHADMASKPSVTATFSEQVVLFEDAYTNAPGEVVQRQSTTTTLTISAYGGANGAYLQVDRGILDDKLVRTGGHSLPTSKVKIPQNSDVVYEIAYQGKVASGAAKDIKVRATLTAINDMSPPPSTAEVTSARLQMEAVSTFPANRARHVFGPLEETEFKFSPDVMGAVSISGNIPENGRRQGKRLFLGDGASTFSLKIQCGMESLPLPFSVLEPSGVEVVEVRPLSPQDWIELDEEPLLNGQAGVAANIDVRVLPSYVSFKKINLLEGMCPAVSVWGCCANTNYFPVNMAHDGIAGGSETYAEEGASVNSQNMLNSDKVAFWPPTRLAFPCEPGGFTFNIPWKWYADGRSRLHDWMVVPQVMTVHSNGTVTISKNGVTITRTKAGNMSWTR